jgi:hypothetical protein
MACSFAFVAAALDAMGLACGFQAKAGSATRPSSLLYKYIYMALVPWFLWEIAADQLAPLVTKVG